MRSPPDKSGTVAVRLPPDKSRTVDNTGIVTVCLPPATTGTVAGRLAFHSRAVVGVLYCEKIESQGVVCYIIRV